MSGRIDFWLRLKKWSLSQAAMIFVNIDPDTCSPPIPGDLDCDFATFNNAHYSRVNEKIGLDDTYDYFGGYEEWAILRSEFSDTYRLLADGIEDMRSPKDWIKQAKIQGISPAFLGKLESMYLALLQPSKTSLGGPSTVLAHSNKASSGEWWVDILDESNPKYAKELAIAIKAWCAVGLEGKLTPKQSILKWLQGERVRLGNLSTESIDRISIVCNWNKSGGPRAQP